MPEFELKDFQLGSARDLFPFSSESKMVQKGAEIFLIFFSIKLGLKIIIFNSKNTYCHIKIQKIDHKIDYNHDTVTKLEFDCSS